MIKHNEFWLRLVLSDKMTMDTLLELMKTFNKSFHALQKEIPSINKSTDGRFKYANWESIQEVTAPLLSKHGFTIEQYQSGDADQPYMTTIIKHDCGYFEEHHCPMMKLESYENPQQNGAAITYYKRYMYVLLLKLSTPDTDLDDINDTPKKPMETTPINRSCPQCKKPLLKKEGQYGPFIGCSGYKEGCRYMEKVK